MPAPTPAATAPHSGLAAARVRPPLGNRDVAAALEQIAELLALQGANHFRIRAYRNAARLLQGPPRPVAGSSAGELDALPGIGADLAGKIGEIVRTGSCALLLRLRAETPPDLTAMLQLPGLGPQRVRALHDELGITTLAQLREAARAGRLVGVHGFGPHLQQRLLDAAATEGATAPRRKRTAVAPRCQQLLAFLRALPAVQRAEAAGSFRRGSETVGDLDLLAQADDGHAVTQAFTRHPEVREVRSAGLTQASVVLGDGLQVDLRVVSRRSFGAAWVYFTGPKAHNLWLRRRAIRRGLKLNEYGVFRDGQQLAGDDEAGVYRVLGLGWIEPAARLGVPTAAPPAATGGTG
jgi:DNA polymerase (family 10)